MAIGLSATNSRTIRGNGSIIWKMALKKSSASPKKIATSRAATSPQKPSCLDLLATSRVSHPFATPPIAPAQPTSSLPPRSLPLFPAIVRRFHESVFEFDSAFKLLSIWSSNSRLSWRRRSQLLGQKLPALFDLPTSRFLIPLFRRFRFAAFRTFHFSLEFKRATRWFEADLLRTPKFRGEASRFVLRIRDVTLRDLAETRLQTLERRLELAEESADFGTWGYDAVTETMVWSKQLARLFGIPPVACRAPIEEFWRALNFKNIEKLRANFGSAIRSGRPFRFSEAYTRPDDHSVRIFEGVGTPLTDSSGKVVRMIGVARDVTALAHTQANLRRLSHQLLTVRTEEQRRIGRELHETTSQTLASLKMTLAAIARRLPPGDRKMNELLRASSSLAGAAVREVRFVSSFLHPPLLEESGLVSAVTSYAKLFAERGRIAVAVHLADDFGRLEKELELTIFRIIQESLTNVHRHARATTVTVRIERDAHSVTVEVRDDGIGLFHVLSESSDPVPLGVGIAGMRERVAQLQGKFDVLSSAGSGTTVRVVLPLAEKETYHDDETATQGSRRAKTLPDSRRRRSRHRPPGRSRAART